MSIKKKLISILTVFAAMAVVFSLVAMAEEGAATEIPNVGFLTALLERLTLEFTALFTMVDKIYAVITNIWC